MNHIVYFSGGLASFFTAKRVLEVQKAEDVILLFTDTRTEDEDLYRFLDDTEIFFGVEITRLVEGRTVWEVFNDVSYIGNTRVDPCSRVLKRELSRNWLEKNYSPEDTTLYFGFDWTEEHRLNILRKYYKPWVIEAPLMSEPLLDRAQMVDELKALSISVPRLYAMGFPHNNCGGFCVKAGQAQFAHLLKFLPERYKFHELEMEKLMAKKPNLRPFLRKNINAKTVYYTLKQWREYLEAGGTYDKREFGGCNCFFTEEQLASDS